MTAPDSEPPGTADTGSVPADAGATVSTADPAPAPAPDPAPGTSDDDQVGSGAARGESDVGTTVFWGLVGAVFLVGIAVATIGNVTRAADFDPQFNRTVVERMVSFGGTYYENGIVNRGPFEIVPYDLAARITSYDGYWFAIAAFAALAALCVSVAAYATAFAVGRSREIGVAAAAVVFVHLTFSGADYAAVLYVRNITAALLGLAWALVWAAPAWSSRRRRVAAMVAIAVLLGLAVQTLLTTVFTGLVLAGVAVLVARERAGRDELPRLVGYATVAGTVTFFSAPVWYLLRGTFAEFWAGWYTYARFMSVGTGRSLGSQFSLGRDQIYAYYQQRPLALAVVFGFAVATFLVWRETSREQRVLHGGLLAWWAAVWVEFVLSQRYSSHYFSVLALPTACMAAALAGHAIRLAAARRAAVVRPGRRSRRATWLVPVVAVVLAVYLSGPRYLREAWHDFVDFEGVAAHAREREQFVSGADRSLRATLDLVSAPGDALLAWTTEPWHYLDNERVPATRFSWSTFLEGAIYLGRTSDDYVLDQTWDWFAQDLAQTQPVAFLDVDGDVKPGTPFAAVVDTDFRTVWAAESKPVALRNDVADALLTPSATDPWTPPLPGSPGAGWAVSGSSLGVSGASGQFVLQEGCGRIDGRMEAPEGGGPASFGLRLVDPAGEVEDRLMSFDGTVVRSGSDVVTFTEMPVGPDPSTFSIVVGARAAGLVVDGELLGVVSIADRSRLVVDGAGSSVTLADMRTGPAPPESGCPS